MNNNIIDLTGQESHYLARVLRLRYGDHINIVDGVGHLWTADFIKEDLIKLHSDLSNPEVTESKKNPLICLAVVVPKQDFDDILRMSTEIGIDVLQPIISDRSVVRNFQSERVKRWDSIINEAVEQSEQLWKPKLKEIICFNEWIDIYRKSTLMALGTTRIDNAIPFESLLNDIKDDLNQICIAIGPEGGWSNHEIFLAREKECANVLLADTILKNTTAAIVATQIMSSWRRSLNSF
ncbi:Ribosomal RNA small subunit methyltransferase E [Prochlorococcus marinus str. SS2]|nr:Ribosomal RNA small subunit methyltransferase E [Prochlorococcus marinus str. SS2]KGG23461.1 Ribosomal RNA small subunit methyltransferase E [Prochlorococcus marinus str. SS35]